MSLQSEVPSKGSSDFRMSTKVYYQSLNNSTLPPSDGNVGNKDRSSYPVQVLQSATDRSLVPLGEFDAFPVAEKASPTQLFSFTSRKGTDLFKESPNDEAQPKAGKRKVSFTSGDLIDSEDVLRLECLQGGAFKMFIPSSPELNRPPLCFEIKPPANVILDLPKCHKKPNIKVVVTTICSTGNPNEKSHQKSEGGIDVTTSNLDDPEIEDLIRELCQIIVETHKNEERNSQRKQLKEPPQVVELYKRKKIQEEESANCEYTVLSSTEAIGDTAFTYHHEDEGYFYFQPQSEPKGSSVRLFVDKICGCLGKAFGLISRDEGVRRPAPMKMEVDNDPQEGYVRCLLMGKTPKNDGDDCACDEQPVAEIRNSSELMDKQSPLVDRIMYLLRKGVSHEFSNETLMDGSGEGDYNTRGYGGDDGTAGGTAKHKGDHKEGVHADDKASRRKSKADKHHTRFRTASGNEMTDTVEEGAEGADGAEGAKENKKHRDKKDERLRRNLCCTKGVDDKHKPYKPAGSKQPTNVEQGDSGEVVHEDAVKEKVGRHKKKSEKMEVTGSDEKRPFESAGSKQPPNVQKGDSNEVLHKDGLTEKAGRHKKKSENMELKGSDEVKPTESAAGSKKPPTTREGSSSNEAVNKSRNDRKKSKQEKRPEEFEGDYDMFTEEIPANQESANQRISESSRLLKRPYFRRKYESELKELEKEKHKKKAEKGSDDESDSSKRKSKKTKTKTKRPKEYERRKMIGTRDREYWASYRRMRRRQMEKQDTEFNESVISANLSVDGREMSSESSSDSDNYNLTEIEYDDPMHKTEKNNTSDRYFRYSRRSQPHRSHLPEEQTPLRTKNNPEEMRDDSAVLEKRPSSRKSKSSSKSSKVQPLDSSCKELSSKRVHKEKQRESTEESKSLLRSKSSTKFLREIGDAKMSLKGLFGRKKKEDMGTKMYISGSPNMQDDETDPRNISEVMEAQTLKDKFDKEKQESKDEPANETESTTYSSLIDVKKNDDSGINLVIPCGTCPSEEADYIGLSSWENPITKSRTAIDSKCESLCISCKNSMAASHKKHQSHKTSPSSTTSIAIRKSILVDRALADTINCCRTSVYSMSEGTSSGLPAVPLLPVSASLDSKLRQQEQLERLNPLDSPTDSACLQPSTDSSDQTLDTSASEITNNSSEVETKSTTFDSGTSVVSNATIDSALAQSPCNESTESKDPASRSDSSHKSRELSSTTVDTWSSISSVSDILRNQSSISSNQDTSSANDSVNGLSSDGSRSLINSAIEPLRSDSKCDDGSQSMYGESSGDSRSTTALSATSTIDSGLSIDSQATSESIQTQESAISKDITNSSGVSFDSRDPNQNDMRSLPSCSTSETERKASNTAMLKRGASQHLIFSGNSNSLEQPKITIANSTTSLSLRPLVKGTSQHLIAPTVEGQAVIKIKSTDAVASVASKADELIAAPSRVSSTASINSAKQICYQVPDMGPTFTDAMVSSAAPGAESNHSALRANTDQESDDRPVVGTEGVLGNESRRGHGEIGLLNNENEPMTTCPMLPVVSDENLHRDEHNVKLSEDNRPAETLEQLPKEKVPNEMTIVETLAENANDSNETENQPSKKKLSRRRHNIMNTFMCISKPCRSARHSDSFSPYRPAQPLPGPDVPRNLSDTIPQTDKRLKEQTHNKRRLFANHSKGKKTKENADQESTSKSVNEEIKLKSILSKTLHKDNRCKLTKKVSFSPTNSFIEAPVTPESSTSRSQSETEADKPMSNLNAFNIRSSSSDCVLPATTSARHLHNENASPTARTSLIRARGSFSDEIDRELRQKARRLEETSGNDSYSCSSQDDDDDRTYEIVEINSGKTREKPRVRLQLSNLMCESIPPKPSMDNLQCVDNFQDDVESCVLMMDEESDAGSERSTQDRNEQDRKENATTDRENYREDRRFSQNKSSKKDEKRKLVSTPKTKAKKIDFLKDCPIENEDAELEKQNSARKLIKKRQLFVQKVSSLIKVTPLENSDKKMTIADCDPIEIEKKKAKKTERENARKNTSREYDSSSTQKHSRGPRIEDDRHKKA